MCGTLTEGEQVPAPTPPLRPNLANEANSGPQEHDVPRIHQCPPVGGPSRSSVWIVAAAGTLPWPYALEATKAAELINGFAQSGRAGLPEPLHSSK
jgi:hypothetical protein